MSSPLFPNTGRPADEWLDGKLSAAGRRLCDKREVLERTIARHPIPALAAAIGVGCLASRLPLARLTATTVRLSLAALPHALFVIGAARAWQMVRPFATAATHEPGPAGWGPAEECVVVCNRLLAAEISASDSCIHALELIQGDQARADLQHVLAVHQDNAARLREQITRLGGRPVSGATPPLRESATFTNEPWGGLQDLEQCNLQLMGEALRNPGIVEDIKNLIVHHLQPRIHENIAALTRAEGYPASGGKSPG